MENRVYELPENEIQNVKKIKKWKWVWKITLGDKYKYYERKFFLNSIDNSYTLHERRNKTMIYGNVPIGLNKVGIFNKKPAQIKKYKDKNKNNQIY